MKIIEILPFDLLGPWTIQSSGIAVFGEDAHCIYDDVLVADNKECAFDSLLNYAEENPNWLNSLGRNHVLLAFKKDELVCVSYQRYTGGIWVECTGDIGLALATDGDKL